GSYVNAGTTDPLTLAASAADIGGSGVASVEFFECTNSSSGCSSGGWSSLGLVTGAPFRVTWPIAVDGRHTFRAVAADRAGKTTTDLIGSRRVDNTPPSVLVSDPGRNVRGTVTLGSTATDGGSGVVSSSYEWSPTGAGDWHATPAAWDTTALADGVYDVRAK